MAMQQTSVTATQLSFGALVGAAHAAVFGNFRRFARLAAVPFLLAVLLMAASIPAALMLPAADLLFMVLDVVPYALLGIALNRALLTGEAAGFLPPEPLGRRTWTYVGYTLLLSLALIVPLAIAVFAGMGAATSLGISAGRIVLPALVLSVALLYALTRLSLTFPALSVDQRLGLAGSWRLTRGNGMKLFGAFVAILVATLLAGALGSGILGGQFSINIGGGIEMPPGATLADILLDQGPAEIWSILVSLVTLGLLTGAYAEAFAQLSGWGAPRQDILERFE